MASIDLAQAEPVSHAKLPDVPGCYILVADPRAMRELGLKPGPSPAALYVGKAKDSIRKRVSGTHLVKSRSGSSTLRRSIGALLLVPLQLRPQPRSLTPSDSKRFTNYRFHPAGEDSLSEWIASNIRVCPVPSPNPVSKEKYLIRQHRPPLNLTDWPNPESPTIRAKRKQCADLARAAA